MLCPIAQVSGKVYVQKQAALGVQEVKVFLARIVGAHGLSTAREDAYL